MQCLKDKSAKVPSPRSAVKSDHTSAVGRLRTSFVRCNPANTIKGAILSTSAMRSTNAIRSERTCTISSKSATAEPAACCYPLLRECLAFVDEHFRKGHKMRKKT